METPERISSETREQFPIGSFVKLSEKGRKFTNSCWFERIGKVIGYASHWREIRNGPSPKSVLLVVWEGRTRRRITRRHRSDFVPLPPAQSERRGDAVGGPEC